MCIVGEDSHNLTIKVQLFTSTLTHVRFAEKPWLKVLFDDLL
jgi:hypothetical protein